MAPLLSLLGACLGALTLSEAAAVPKHVLHTSTTPSGQTVDWIAIESQGNIASAPPALNTTSKRSAGDLPEPALAQFELAAHPELQGPAGTVPKLRDNGFVPPIKYGPPIAGQASKNRPRASAPHWYASTQASITNYGGDAHYSTYNPFTETHDFSLIQVAVGAGRSGTWQDVEAGWQRYPDMYGDTVPHLFTYYTVNDYASAGDNLGCYNQACTGWVQVDTTTYPGATFALSTEGGAQYEVDLQWMLYQGNWWLAVNSVWIGYYPTSLYTANVAAANGMASYSDTILYYGEIYQSDQDPSTTTTDMGSGEFAEKGFQHAAFIRLMTYQLQPSETSQALTPYVQTGQYVDDTSRYDFNAYYNSGTNWGSYMYLGGPGAGGVVGA